VAMIISDHFPRITWPAGTCVDDLRGLLPLVAHCRISRPPKRPVVHDESLLEDLLERENIRPSRRPAERHVCRSRRVRVYDPGELTG
jgi:hypothetical protein